MAKKPTIVNIQSGYQATETINSNFENVRDAFDNLLSRDGSTPNSMDADLDMNSNQILNLPPPTTPTEPVRKREFDNVLNDVESIVKGLDLDGTATYTAQGVGAVPRLIYSKLGDVVSVKDFGAVGDGITDDTAAIKACLAANLGCKIYFPAGVYLLSDTLEIDGHYLIGEGVDNWLISFPDQPKTEVFGTHLRFIGTGTKRYKVTGTSDQRISGGWRTNSSSVNSEDSFYKILNFMNENAVDTTPATQRLISAAIYVKPGVERWGIEGIRIYPSYNGLIGYNNKTIGLADNWDIGILIDSAEWGLCQDCQFVGYWRMAALLISHAPNDLGIYEAGAEHNKFLRCMFQGFRGISIRGGDYFRVTALTTNTIEIPWTSCSPIASSGNTLRSGSTTYSWTGLSKSGDKLTLTGVTPSPVTNGLSIGDFMRNNTLTSGVGGTTFRDCYIAGLDHFSSRPSEWLGLGLGVSAAIEANNARGVRFVDCKIATREQVMFFLLEADDWEISGDLEAGSWVNSSNVSGNVGSRFIALTSLTSDVQATYPAGNVRNLYIRAAIDQSIDYEPIFTRTNTRFSDTGLFDQTTVFVSSKQIPTALRTTFRATKGTDGIYFETENGDLAGRFTQSGNFEAKGQITVGTTGTANIQSLTGTSLQFRIGTTAYFSLSTSGTTLVHTNFTPNVDNTRQLGSSSARWSVVYAGTGTINTSDAREKCDVSVIEDAERRVALKLKGAIKKFRFNNAVAIKGKDARIHFGVLAQDIATAFVQEGLDPTSYAMFCYDKWDEMPEQRDSDGNIIVPFLPSGDRYGIRYDELFAFILATL